MEACRRSMTVRRHQHRDQRPALHALNGELLLDWLQADYKSCYSARAALSEEPHSPHALVCQGCLA